MFEGRSAVVDDDDEVATLVICQGGGRCRLRGDSAYRAQLAGCPWCRRERVDCLEGTIAVIEPATA